MFKSGFFGLIIGISSVFGNNPLIVTTPTGEILGRYSTSYDGRTYIEFLGIPYAEPPVEDLQLQEPVPKRPWRGVLVANKSTSCLQVNHTPEPEGGTTLGVEDCLYLNVYVPGRQIPPEEKLPVILYIHGGALMYGNHRYGGPKFLMDRNDAIFVNFNYRLGALGFLSTGDEHLPGNLGLKDQALVMEWVRENIGCFGGDGSDVTLAGLSAGGASVHLHYFSPLTRGMFRRGISVSGCALNPWTLDEDPLRKARIIGRHVNCTQNCTEELARCLKQAPARDLTEGLRLLRPWLYNPFSPLGPVVDGYCGNPYLPKHPYECLAEGEVMDVPWITSMASSEGLYPVAEFLTKPQHLNNLNDNWRNYTPAILHYMDTIPDGMKDAISTEIRLEYLGNARVDRESFDPLVKLVGDRLFVYDWESSARMQAAVTKSPVYAYYYDYLSEKRESLVYVLTGSREKLGVSHGDDILQMMTYPFEEQPAKMTSKDERMKDILINIWMSFVKTSKPGIKKWIPVDKNCKRDFRYLIIGREQEMSMEESPEMGNRGFWEGIPFAENSRLFPNQRNCFLN